MARAVTVSYEVWPTAEAMARASAQQFVDAVNGAVSRRGVARVAVSGGSTPQRTFQLLAAEDEAFRAAVPWEKLHLYWVDERCVGPEDPESNYGVCRELLLQHVPIPESQVYRMEGELEPELAASRYETVLRNSMKLEGAESPAFDLLTLGMGPDGHTASLFPHTAALDEMGRLVVANHVPQKETWRLTLTWPVINQARQVSFELAGEEKAGMLAEVLTGPRDPERLPSQLIRPASGKLLFLLDEAAAAGLPAAEARTASGAKLGRLEI